MASLSFPFRVDPATRRVATNPDGSDPEASEAIALHILTFMGERPMRPGFGTESLPFGPGLDPSALQLQLTEHGWDNLSITDITDGPPANGRVESIVSWERNV
jgi:hypothetical protein